jgi:TATA-binding protein-associated factor
MVAPVRETVSQTLAALLTHMPRRSVLHVHAALLQMVQLSPGPAQVSPHPIATSNGKANGKGKGKASNGPTGGKTGEFAWQVRHAGLGGIKYEVAVRPDLFDDPMNGKAVLKGVVDAAVSGWVYYLIEFYSHKLSVACIFLHRLCDHDDDVRSVAATCLTPITSQLVERMPEEVGRVLGVLWDCLSEMKDDLSSSVGFIMELLGMFITMFISDRILIAYTGKLLGFDASIAILSNTDTG